MDVIKFSQQTKRQATSLLEYGNILQTLSSYGKVILTGSYQYDLMYDPDIDLTVISENPEKSAYHALLDFIKQRKFQKYQFGDFSKYPHKDRPQDTIVVLMHEYQGKRWEIEIWFKKSISEDDQNYEKLLAKITAQQKKAILERKHFRKLNGITKHEQDSLTIYKEVMLAGKTS